MPGAPTWLEGGRALLISCNGLHNWEEGNGGAAGKKDGF